MRENWPSLPPAKVCSTVSCVYCVGGVSVNTTSSRIAVVAGVQPLPQLLPPSTPPDNSASVLLPLTGRIVFHAELLPLRVWMLEAFWLKPWSFEPSVLWRCSEPLL